MTAVGPMSYPGVPKKTTYEGLRTLCREWHSDMTDIADQR